MLATEMNNEMLHKKTCIISLRITNLYDYSAVIDATTLHSIKF